MHREQHLAQLVDARLERLDDQQLLAVLGHRAFPAIDRRQRGDDVHARAETPFDELAREGTRVEVGGDRRQNDDDRRHGSRIA